MRPLVSCVLFCGLAWAQTPPADRGILLRGGTVHTVSGPVIENGSVLMRNGKIVGVARTLPRPKGTRSSTSRVRMSTRE